jgi:hypothetical protein
MHRMAHARMLDPDDELVRRLVVPEEDRRTITSRPSGRACRWFRTPNIVPIEHYQLSDRAPAPTGCGVVLPFPRRNRYR